MSLTCTSCNTITIKRNGTYSNGKQNHQCLVCRRQFVEQPEKKEISGEVKERIRGLVALFP